MPTIRKVQNDKVFLDFFDSKTLLIKQLYLLHFKNYSEQNFIFSEKLNLIVGENGTGKTNLLDAIHFLCLTKSAFHATDQFLIQHSENTAVARGIFDKTSETFEVACGLQTGRAKVLKINKQAYHKLSEHIGKFLCVLIHPYDTDLVREGSETRRKFFDQLICQVDTPYLDNLLIYNHILKQRNSLLKQFSERQFFDAILLQQYDNQVISIGKKIFETRRIFIENFVPILTEQYRYLAEGKERVEIIYETDLNEPDWEQKFYEARQRDRLLQRTTIGTHRDDYACRLDNYPIDKYGSQGQQKSFVIALKLAQMQIMEKITTQKPILLLDDIFEKLDENRIRKIIQLIENQTFGQVFVTDAHPQRCLDFFGEIEDKKVIRT